jgi:hypothetical protein
VVIGYPSNEVISDDKGTSKTIKFSTINNIATSEIIK